MTHVSPHYILSFINKATSIETNLTRLEHKQRERAREKAKCREKEGKDYIKAERLSEMAVEL